MSDDGQVCGEIKRFSSSYETDQDDSLEKLLLITIRIVLAHG